MIICDFCSGTPVTTRYPARDATMSRSPGATIASIGDWAACAVCAEHVRAGDQDGLARWSVAHITGCTPDPDAVAMVRQAQEAAFWTARTGPGRPVTQEEASGDGGDTGR